MSNAIVRRIGLALISCLLLQAMPLFALQTSKPKRRSRARHASTVKKKPVAPLRTKVAEGMYELHHTGPEPSGTWQEPWALYKTKSGYELEEQWKAAKIGNPNSVVVNVFLDLAQGLYPIHAKIGSEVSGNQIDCAMTLNEFKCAAGGKESSLPVSGPYNLFLPSPWLLSSIGRRSSRNPEAPTKVQLVQMAGMGPDGPKLMAFDAEVQYVGDDVIDVGGKKIHADIYELKSADTPAILMWISAEGVVILMQDSQKPDQRLELVEYKKLAAFD